MSALFRILTITALGSSILLPYFGSRQGWGLQNEANPAVVQLYRGECRPEQRDAYSRCPDSHRNRFRRSFSGGGTNYGK